MKNILVTGGAGFIGSNFIPYFLHKYQEYQIINVDKLTYAGSLENLAEIAHEPRYHFIQGDITDKQLLQDLFYKFDFRGVIHLAAESHVDRSIQDSSLFVKTNIEGTFVLLEVAKSHWMEGTGVIKNNHLTSCFLYVSTDEVYGSLETTGYFTEESNYAPNNPYSASKAAGDMLVRSYVQTHGLQAITTHASNNYGPKQYPEKLIPIVIQKALSHKFIPVHGVGSAIRDWLYVLDHCKGIDLAFHQGKIGQHYNMGGNYEKTNLEIVFRVCDLLDKLIPNTSYSYQSLIKFVTDRPGNDQRYALDTTKANKELGWYPEEIFDIGLRKTVEWYLKQYYPRKYSL